MATGHETVAVVAHGGVTYDLLRTLLGDDAVPELGNGVPSCAVTTLAVDGSEITVRGVADESHLD